MPTRAALLLLLAMIASGCAGGPGPVGQTQQPGTTPVPGGTQNPVGTPSGSTCNLVTAAELSAIWGVQMNAVPDTDNSCTWSASTGLPAVTIRFEATDLSTARALLGNEADVTVAGNPGVIGNLFGVILYVQRGAVDLVVQTVLLEDTPDNRAKVITTAEKALSRVP